MECPFPRLLPRQGISVSCGNCAVCRQNKIEDWTTRLRIESELASSCYFVTLTYDDVHLPHDDRGFPCFDKKHLQLFHKRLRATLSRGSFQDPVLHSSIELADRPFKYYLVSEYGGSSDGNHRPHYHGIYFNLPDDINVSYLLVRQCWQYGSVVEVSSLTPGRLGYTVAYAYDLELHVNWNPEWMRPFNLMSKGLGSSVLEDQNKLDWWRSSPHNRVYFPDHGAKLRLSRYLKDRIFDDDMKARIMEVKQDREASRLLHESPENRKRIVDSYYAFEDSVRRRLKRTKSHV